MSAVMKDQSWIERAEGAANYLTETDHKIAELRVKHEKDKRKAKATWSAVFLRVEGKNAEERKAQAETHPDYQLAQAAEMTSLLEYEKLHCIGEGTYGQVYRARPIHNCNVTADNANKTSSSSSISSSSYVALKKIRLHHAGYYGIPPTVLREIKILKSLSHPNMVIMHEVVTSKGVEELDWEEDSCVNRKKKSAVVGGGNAVANGRGNKNSNAAASAGNYTNSSHGVNVTPMPSSTSNDNNEVITNNKEKKKKAIIANEKQYDALRESYKGNLFLVLEYVSHDLTGLLDMAYKFTEVQAKSLMISLARIIQQSAFAG